jgi:hypothetical protein
MDAKGAAMATEMDGLPEDAPLMFACGPKLTCPDGSEHDYSKWLELPEGVGTAVCAICGHRAVDDAYWM